MTTTRAAPVPLAALAARHLLSQRRVMAALAGVVRDSLWRDFTRARPSLPELPGPEQRATLAPPSQRLIRDYLQHVGGDAGAHLGTIPAHLFPHWSMPVVARSSRGLPYRLVRAVNGGCRLTLHAALLATEPLTVRARLVGVKDDGRRVVLQQHVVTEQGGRPPALEAELYVIVPSAGPRAGSEPSPRAPQEKPRVPTGARELARFELSASAGLAFALLTGDVNPIHWVRPYARAAGFEGPMLHGFATLARVVEALQRELFGGATDRLHAIDVRFTRPLYLPMDVGLYLVGQEFFVGPAAGELAQLTGSFSERSST